MHVARLEQAMRDALQDLDPKPARVGADEHARRAADRGHDVGGRVAGLRALPEALSAGPSRAATKGSVAFPVRWRPSIRSASQRNAFALNGLHLTNEAILTIEIAVAASQRSWLKDVRWECEGTSHLRATASHQLQWRRSRSTRSDNGAMPSPVLRRSQSGPAARGQSRTLANDRSPARCSGLCRQDFREIADVLR